MADDTNAEVIDFPGTPTTGVADTGTVALPELAEVVDGEIVEGLIVDEPPSVMPSVVLLPVQVVKVVVKHDHTRTAGRHLMYIPLGALVGAKRLWTAGRRPGTSGSSGLLRRPATTRPRFSGRTSGRSSSRTGMRAGWTGSKSPYRCCWWFRR